MWLISAHVGLKLIIRAGASLRYKIFVEKAIETPRKGEGAPSRHKPHHAIGGGGNWELDGKFFYFCDIMSFLPTFLIGIKVKGEFLLINCSFEMGMKRK